MDFNTGSGGPQRPGNNPPPPPPSGSVGFSSPGPARGAGGGDYNLGDPVGSFVATAREIILNPAGFFRSVPRGGGFVPPLVFAVICSAIFAVLSGIITFLISLLTGAQGFGGAIGTLLGTIILTPLLTAVGLFIGAGIYHLLVLLLVRPNSGYSATFRVVAYATVVQVVNWLSVIPLLGVLVAIVVGIYGLILGVIGIREVHSTTTGRAVAVILIPTAVLLLLVFLVVGSLLLLLFAGSQQQL